MYRFDERVPKHREYLICFSKYRTSGDQVHVDYPSINEPEKYKSDYFTLTNMRSLDKIDPENKMYILVDDLINVYKESFDGDE